MWISSLYLPSFITIFDERVKELYDKFLLRQIDLSGVMITCIIMTSTFIRKQF